MAGRARQGRATGRGIALPPPPPTLGAAPLPRCLASPRARVARSCLCLIDVQLRSLPAGRGRGGQVDSPPPAPGGASAQPALQRRSAALCPQMIIALTNRLKALRKRRRSGRERGSLSRGSAGHRDSRCPRAIRVLETYLQSGSAAGDGERGALAPCSRLADTGALTGKKVRDGYQCLARVQRRHRGACRPVFCGAPSPAWHRRLASLTGSRVGR